MPQSGREAHALLKRFFIFVAAHEDDTKLLAGGDDILVQLRELRGEAAAWGAPVSRKVNGHHIERAQVVQGVFGAAGMAGLRRVVRLRG